jgi:Ca-activated chloride channel family protein
MKKFVITTLMLGSLASCSEYDDAGMLGYSDNFDYEYSSTEKYNDFQENPFVSVSEVPISTFSIDADGGSYSNVRRFLSYGQLPPKGAIRTEELINYFALDYDEPTDNQAIAINGEVSSCPWQEGNKLIRIGIKGKKLNQYPASNLVFLIDVSGSMGSTDKLPLLKQGFLALTENLKAEDKISIVTYAGSAGIVLQPTAGSNKDKIRAAINSLGSGGSTAGAAGIKTAYELAEKAFIEGGNNRVILGSDGDFNVGISSQEELVSLIEEKRDSGVFLTVLGVGQGNYNEAMMEQVANHGNGTYEYIDSYEQAKKVFVYEYAKFYTVAKDVKVQVEFNPNLVNSYRLIGYENRLLENEDFEDDQKDAGEIGAEQTITALYEIVPTSNPATRQEPSFTIDFRYKEPDANESQALQLEIYDEGIPFESATENMRFAASVAGYGMLLRESAFKGTLSYSQLTGWVANAQTYDPHGFRQEFVNLIETSSAISSK